MNPLLVLASASPFRRALLENAGLVFEAKAAKIDERALEKPLEDAGAAPETVALALAEAKARDVIRHFDDALVIGSDQTMSWKRGSITSQRTWRKRHSICFRCRERPIA